MADTNYVIEVGDIILVTAGYSFKGQHFIVDKVTIGSWSGKRYYDCHQLVYGPKREAIIYDDECKLVKKRRVKSI